MKMDEAHIRTLANEAISTGEGLFLLDIKISAGGDIVVTVDGDSGVTLGECVRISRHIESALEAEEIDFSLRVETPDITKPFSHPRQFNKNIGRHIKLKTHNGNYQGELIKVEADKLYLKWKERQPKPIGKGKQTVNMKAIIPMEEVIEAKVKIMYQ
jgi:ribosome maturation factor RimP